MKSITPCWWRDSLARRAAVTIALPVDRQIFLKAKEAGAVVMTKDRDFLNLLAQQGPPPQVIWLRVGNTSNVSLQRILLRHLNQAMASLSDAEPWVEIRSTP